MKFGKVFSSTLRAVGLLALSTALHAAPAASMSLSSVFTQFLRGDFVRVNIQITDDSSSGFSGGAFTITYPAGVVNPTGGLALNNCGGGIIVTPGAGSMSVSGMGLPAGPFGCAVAFDVTSTIPGSYTVGLPAGAFTASDGVNAAPTSASFTVLPVYLVNTTADSGAGSLRQAILDANSICAGGDYIGFSIPTGPFVISPATQLPAITCPVVVDGYSQPGSARNTNASGGNNAAIMIDLNGAGCSGCNGLILGISGNQVQGLAIHSFGGAGIASNIGGGTNTILGNYIGTDPGGMVAAGNGGNGITVAGGYANIGDGSAGGRNLVTANTGAGILVINGGAQIDGNQIGGLRDASAGAGNGNHGILLDAANYSANTLTDNLIIANAGAGILTRGTSARVIAEANESFGNSGPGLDINDDGVNANDDVSTPYDTDSVQNYPVITSVSQVGGATYVSGYLRSTANRFGTVFLYANGSATGFNEGGVFLSSIGISTDASGTAPFTATIAGTWDNISAQATLDQCGDGCLRSSEYSPRTAATNPFVVTNTNDSGTGSLRAALDFAFQSCVPKRAAAGGVARLANAGPTITFNIPGTGVQTIRPATPLPVLNCDYLVIDGFTQPRSSPNSDRFADNAVRLIEINGGSVNPISANGLELSGDGITIRGLVINGFGGGTGIMTLTRAGAAAPRILGNAIGTDATGSSAVRNSVGVANAAGAGAMAVGSPSIADRNLISGNAFAVMLRSGDMNIVANNLIGLNAAGTGALPNETAGVTATGVTNTRIEANAISGNTGTAIYLGDSAGTTIADNHIGTNALGNAPVPNQWAITFDTPGAFGSVGPDNTIAYNGAGIQVFSIGVSIRGNSIHSNGGFGIDLTRGGGLPTNDSCDADTGANNLQNYPVITSVTAYGDHTNVTGTLDSTANRTFGLDFFQNAPTDDASYRAGRSLLGSTDVATTLTPSCVTPFSVDLPAVLPVGTLITATATDLTTLDTSGFSAAVAATAPSAPALSLSTTSLSFGPLLSGTPSASQRVTLTNSGTAPLTLSVPVSSANFAQATDCTGTLAPSASCNVDVTFTPPSTGTFAGTVTISSDAPGNPHTVSLSGIGAAPPTFALSVGTSLTPGQVAVASILIQNPSGNTVTYGNFSATLTYPAGFVNDTPNASYPQGGCGATSYTGGLAGGNTIGFAGGGSVAAGSSCSRAAMQIIAPATPGTYTFTIPANGFTITSPFAYSNPNPISIAVTVALAPAPGVGFSPTTLVFASQNLGTSSASQAVTLTNTGNATLNVSSIATTGDFAQANACPASIAAGGTCTINVTFSPTVAGPRSGTLSVASNASGSPHTVPLSGTGVATSPAVSLSPVSLNFASRNVGTQSAPQAVTLTNTGSATLAIISIGASGDFAQASGCGASLAPGAICTINVTFAPTVAGARTGTLTVTSNASGSPHTVPLSGTGVATSPAVSLTPTSLSFASRTVSTTSPAQTVTLANTGNGPLTIASMAISGDFSFSSSCGPSVAAGGSCTVDVTFTPLVAGARTGNLTLIDDAAGSPHLVALSGTGLSSAAAVMNIAPSLVVFSPQQVGSSSTPEIVTVSNSGTAPLTFSSLGITGEFSIVTPPASSTPACPVTLSPGSACRVALVFHPAGLNQRNGVLSIATNAGTGTLNVMGTGLAAQPPQLTMASTLDFGTQPVGVPSAGHPLEIRNTSPFIATLTELTVTGDFAISDTCLTIDAGATCSPLLTFQPSALGPRAGTLTVRTLRDANPYTVNLTGVGEENRRPALEIAPLRVGFGNSFLGQLVTRSVVLRNSGLAPLTISGIAVTGDFFSDVGCIGSLVPGSSCTLRITFAPGIPNGRNGTVLITSNAPGSPHSVELSGTGCIIPSLTAARLGVLFCGP